MTPEQSTAADRRSVGANAGDRDAACARRGRRAPPDHAVLPAEYGIDPLGTGKALGLLDLYAAPIRRPPPAPRPEPSNASTSKTVMPQSPPTSTIASNSR